MAAIRKTPVTVAEIINYSENVRLYRLEPHKKSLNYKAGEFLHLAMDEYDPSFSWPESRVFSLANSPTRPELIDVLVSKKGVFTTAMFENIKIGDELWIKLPFGVFNFDESLNHNTVLIAGGTGISPYISFLQYAIDKDLDASINLNFGVRDSNLIIIEELLKEAKTKLANFSYNLYVENLTDNIEGLELKKGRLPVKQIIRESLKLENPIFYLSGPPAMISAFDVELKNQKVRSKQIKYDKWE